MELLTLSKVSKRFSQQENKSVNVLSNLNFTMERKRKVALLGPSGCGKTTILRLIARLEKPSSGEIHYFGENIGFIFQEPRLIPWKTVSHNILFTQPHKAIRKGFLSDIGLEEYKDFYPHQLSGGLKQRVNIGRALLFPKELLLMDEPFQNLDSKSRITLLQQILQYLKEESSAAILVTHILREALLFSDEVYFLSEKPAEIVGKWSSDTPSSLRFDGLDWLFEQEKKVLSDYPFLLL